MKKLTAILLLLAMTLSLLLTACDGGNIAPDVTSDTVAPTETPTEAPAEDATEAPTEAPTEEAATEDPTEEVTAEAPTEEAATEAATEAPKPEAVITDGMMLYYEDFSKYGEINDADDAMEALGWKIETTVDDFAYSDWTAKASIKDGKLIIVNYDPTVGFKGDDSYALMLDEDYMKPIAEYGDYTLQYDVTYTDASNYKRYICLLTDYMGDTYNSYHFRIGGYANNQGHVFGEWVTYDEVNPEVDLSAKLTANEPDKGTTIAYKLLGIETPIKDDSAIENFRNVTVTIRIRHDSDLGNVIYMKTAEMEDFICVSMPTLSASGAADWSNVEGAPGLAFKVGGAIVGSVDNIALWAGLGEMPEDTTVTYTPAE